MNRAFVLTLALLIVLPADAQNITVVELDEGHYRLTLTSEDLLGVEEAQARLLQDAHKACGKQPVSFGRYEFENLELVAGTPEPEDPTGFSFRQDVYCGSHASQLTAPDPAPPGPVVHPFTDPEGMVRELTERYFLDIAEGRLDEAMDARSAELAQCRGHQGPRG